MPELTRLSQTTQVLLRELKSAKPNSSISSGTLGKVAPAELEAAFEKLNDAFSFNPATGEVTKNAAMQLSAEEQQVVQQLLDGYHRQVKEGKIALQRGTNQRFVSLADEPEEDRQGVVKRTLTEQSTTQDPSAAMAANSETEATFSSIDSTLDTLLAQGCGWQWWRKTHWWGIRISFNKTAVNWLASGGAAASGILASMGIGGIAATVIAVIVGALKAIANENGIRIYITWVGIWWATPKPTSSGGC
jgi:hypothetical protein